MERTRVKLKPCPFCGKVPRLWKTCGVWLVECETHQRDCGGTNPFTQAKIKSAAIKRWNTRRG